MRVGVAKETRRAPPSSSSPYTPHWMQQSSANYSCYTRNAAVWLCGCGWAIDLARLAWNLGHRWWSSLPSPSWKQQNDTWEKPIEIVSSLLHICHGHGNGLWTQCVPGECGQFQVGFATDFTWQLLELCVCVSVCEWGHTFATSAFDLYENSKLNSGQFVKFPCAHAAHRDLANSISSIKMWRQLRIVNVRCRHF